LSFISLKKAVKLANKTAQFPFFEALAVFELENFSIPKRSRELPFILELSQL
jgi:hypothetical protein